MLKVVGGFLSRLNNISTTKTKRLRANKFKLNKLNFQLLGKVPELTFLNELNRIFLTENQLKKMIDLALTKIVKFLKARAGLIMLLDEHGDILVVAPHRVPNKNSLEPIKQKCREIFFASQPAKETMKKKEMIILQQAQVVDNLKNSLEITAGEGYEMAVYVPLWIQDNINGMMLFYFNGRRTIRKIKKSLLASIAEQITIAIEKANFFEQMQKRMEQFSALYTMSHLINCKLNLEEIITKSLPFLAAMFEADKAWVMLYEDRDLLIKEPYIGLEIEERQSLARLSGEHLEFFLAVLDSGQVLLLNNPSHDVSFANNLGVELANILLIPLKMQNTPIGLIYVANSKKGKFTLMDSQLATSVGMQLAGVWEREKLQQKLAEENAKLEMANRLKSQFLANMSHELRTPMNSIIGYTHCILEGMDGAINQDQDQDLRRVLNSAEHLLQLINDILDISKIEAGKMEIRSEPFDLLNCLNSTLLTVEKLACIKGLKILKEIPDYLPAIVGDSNRLCQILLNLLSNAIKFTQNGYILLRARSVEKYVEVSIEDTGIGIEPQALSYIFEEFRQGDGSTTRKYGGTGLGLAITKKLVELQGGSIWIESQLGKGSKFTFTLPTIKMDEERQCVK